VPGRREARPTGIIQVSFVVLVQVLADFLLVLLLLLAPLEFLLLLFLLIISVIADSLPASSSSWSHPSVMNRARGLHGSDAIAWFDA